MDGKKGENCQLDTSEEVFVGENQDWRGIQSPTIKHLLLWKLQSASDVSSKTLGVSVDQGTQIEFNAIPLHKIKDEMQQRYVSAIAFKLASILQRPIMEIATQIAANFLSADGRHHTTIPQRPLEAALDDFTVTVVPPGWIHLQLSDVAIAAWLQRLAQTPPWCEWGSGEDGEIGSNLSPDSSPITHHPLPNPAGRATPNTPHPSPITLFPVQYAHARCCSLLRLAHRESMITLKEPDPDGSPTCWSAIAPDPIPWLDTKGKLRLSHPAEHQLISELLQLLDDLYSLSPPNHPIAWDKTANHLSQVFQSFYSQCRIWGEVKTQTLELAQARLGLIAATQPLLRLVLQDMLGVTAPLEL